MIFLERNNKVRYHDPGYTFKSGILFYYYPIVELKWQLENMTVKEKILKIPAQTCQAIQWSVCTSQSELIPVT